MGRQYSDPVSIIVMIMRPPVCWTVPAHEVSFARVNPRRLVSVVRPYLDRFSRTMTRSVTRFHSGAVTRSVIGFATWFSRFVSRSVIRTDARSVALIVALRSVRSWPCNLNRLILVTRLEVILVAGWLTRSWL